MINKIIKLPKHFNSNDYINLNCDIRENIKDISNFNSETHFLKFGHEENRKYNSLINTNYKFLLHFCNINETSYDYFYDMIIDSKLNNNSISQFLDDINNNTTRYQINIMDLVETLLFDIGNDFNYIKQGIFSDRDFAKYINHDELRIILENGIDTMILNSNKINSRYNNEKIELSLNEIYEIKDKHTFFYHYFNFHTNYIVNLGFEIRNSPSKTKTAVIIESRNHIMFKHIVYNTMFNLGSEWNLHIFCGYDNYKYIFNNFPNVKITILPFFNFPVEIYDFIYLNNFFWDLIDTEDVMIFQTDVYFVDNPHDLLTINDVYIGAPHANIHNNTSYLTPKGFGANGGLSFRKKSAMQHCINNVKCSNIDNYRSLHEMKNVIRTPVNYCDINHEILLNNIITINNNVGNIELLSSNIIAKMHNNTINDQRIINQSFNNDLIFEDVYYSHAIEMLKYPTVNPYIAKHFAIQEKIHDEIYTVCGVHGWDKKYLSLNFHKKILKKYTIKLLNKVRTNQQLIQYVDQNLNQQTCVQQDANVINILIICHNMGGGTEKYVQDIINISNKYLKEQGKKICMDIIRLKDSNDECTNLLLNNINIKLIAQSDNILVKKYDIIHIHYLNEPAFILYDYIMEYMNSQHPPKLIITIHDYHLITDDRANDYHLTIYNSELTLLNELKQRKNNPEKFRLLKELFLKANVILTGGSLCKTIYSYIFELPVNLITVCAHPEPIYYQPICRSYNQLNYTTTLNIAVIGAISINKGSHMIQSVSKLIAKNKLQINIYHIGSGFNYNHNIQSNIIQLGSYSSEEKLRDILIENHINLIWFPVYRHESYCYTLTLAMQTGLPIIAFDSGTFRERLQNYASPYFIHDKKYEEKQLLDDLCLFWQKLKKNNISKQLSINNFKYDNFNYQTLYEI